MGYEVHGLLTAIIRALLDAWQQYECASWRHDIWQSNMFVLQLVWRVLYSSAQLVLNVSHKRYERHTDDYSGIDTNVIAAECIFYNFATCTMCSSNWVATLPSWHVYKSIAHLSLKIHHWQLHTSAKYRAKHNRQRFLSRDTRMYQSSRVHTIGESLAW